MTPAFQYPPAHQSNITDNFHGTPVPDPYRWMEDPESPALKTWLEAESQLTTHYLEVGSQRETIKNRLTELWNFPRFTAPVERGGHYFFQQNDGLQNQSAWYELDSLDGEPRLLIDPNLFSEDGTVALVYQAFSENGKLMAYERSVSGSDLVEIYIRDIDNDRDYDEVVRWGRFVEIAWASDGSGFYYNRYPEPGSVADEDLYNHNKVCFHRVGTPQTEDLLIYERPDAKNLMFSPVMSQDGKFLWLIGSPGASVKNSLYYRESQSSGDFIRLIDDLSAMHQPIGSVGTTFYILTDRDAPRGRIIAIDVNQPEDWHELVPEQDDVLSYSTIANNQIIALYMHDAHHRLAVYNLDGTFEYDIPLPTIGSISGLTARQNSSEIFFSFESFLYPPAVYRYDLVAQDLSVFRQPKLDLNVEQYETSQVFFMSKDGTRVPMFLTHKKGLVLDGQNPALLFGYGGFSISLTPFFSVSNFHWVEQGGILAWVNLRGGNEYGDSWHEAGMLGKKQNVFDDFIAAAEWLVEHDYTSSAKLAIMGGSNGGLLVAACMLQRPDLFGAVLCVVPVTDMLRYSMFTAGRYWIGEYGNAPENPEHFKFLYAYSPVHNVKTGTSHPPIMISTAESDDRVVPMHSLKFTAALQAADTGKNPILLRFEFKAGHGNGKPTSKLIDEAVDAYIFASKAFGTPSI
jgi:prolyl oligopeptidase